MMGVADAEVVVVGGGPAGSAAAITVAAAGHRVLILDRQTFPRDKPCGDGVTPRAVAMLDRLGVKAEADARFHRVEGFRVRVAGRSLRRPFPHHRAGLPGYALVARRTELDSMLVDRARQLGATVLERTQGDRPVWETGRVVGVETTSGNDHGVVRAPLVIAADGATSRMAKSVGVEDPSTIYGYAIRAEMVSSIGDNRDLELFPRLTVDGRTVPGYGWVFPLGKDRVNVGVGFLSRSRTARVPVRPMQDALFTQIPSAWGLGDWHPEAGWHGWKLLMGLGRRPIWRPGIMLAGDAVGAVRPTSGAGISKALRTGFLAGCAAVDALAHGTTHDLSAYESALLGEFRRSYLIGRWFARALTNPRFMRAVGSAMTYNSGTRVFEDLLSDVVITDATARDERRIPEPEPTP